jgi:hypothetical protein
MKKPLFDWMMFSGQKDQRPKGLIPLCRSDDGTWNESSPAKNVLTDGSTNELIFCARRQARVALGVEPLLQEGWCRPTEYAKIERDLVFDLEGAEIVHALDITSSILERETMIERLCFAVREMKAEAKGYGKRLRVGSYLPITPVATNINPADSNYKQLMDRAIEDYKPWRDVLDFVVPECSIYSRDLDHWLEMVNGGLEIIRQQFTCPIYCLTEFTFMYGPWTQEEKLRGKLLPPGLWRAMTQHLSSHPLTNGQVLWGQDAEVPELNRPPDTDGTRQLPFTHVEKHVQAALEIYR